MDANKAMDDAPSDSRVRDLFHFRGDRPVSLDLDALFASRGFADTASQLAVLQEVYDNRENLQTYSRVLNRLEIFAVRIMKTQHNKETAYQYCAVYFCDLVEKWAPLVSIQRNFVDTEFFTDGRALYLEWAQRLGESGRRPESN
jgi:hypothetical protein